MIRAELTAEEKETIRQAEMGNQPCFLMRYPLLGKEIVPAAEYEYHPGDMVLYVAWPPGWRYRPAAAPDLGREPKAKS